MSGKAYANRKPMVDNDFYQTPKSLTWELIKTGLLKDVKTILEPCSGKGAISNELKKVGFIVDEKDLTLGNDFLADTYTNKYDAVVMNPPFKYWDEFITKAKKVSNLVISIGRTNYFGAKSRAKLWENLQYVYVFNRQVAYDRPFREDGKIWCGCLITGWFVFNTEYKGEPVIRFIDVDKYVVKKERKKCHYNKVEE